MNPDTGPDLIPARILNEFTYCPRLAWYEWIQGQFEDNSDTADGTFQHRRVDRPDRRSFDVPNAGLDADSAGDSFQPFHARSVMLSSHRHGIIAKMDLLEIDGHEATPVDYKRGKPPQVPEGAYDPERVQLAAQTLILQENGYTVNKAVIYYVASKTRVTIAITPELIDLTLSQIQALRDLSGSGKIPLPLKDSPKCPRCSLVGICLPDETQWLIQTDAKSVDTRLKPNDEEVRRLVPARGDGEPAYILTQGAQVGKSDERLVVRLKGEKLQEIKIHDLSQVSVFGNVQITAQALKELAIAGVPIAHLSMGGWFYALTTGFGPRNIELRIKQFAAAGRSTDCLCVARSMIHAKIKNQRTLLRRNAAAESNPPLTAMAASATKHFGSVLWTRS